LENTDSHAFLLNLAGMVASDAGRFEEGIKLYSDALEIRAKLGPVHLRRLCNSYSNICEGYGAIVKLDEALTAIQKALSLCELHSDTEDPDWWDTRYLLLTTSAEVHRLRSEAPEARKFLQTTTSYLRERDSQHWALE
jgi:tetratricopeptide (TPR) repeat protein